MGSRTAQRQPLTRRGFIATLGSIGLLAAIPAGSAQAGTPGWEPVDVPSVGVSSEFKAVSGSASDNVWAVGSYQVKEYVPVRPLAQHWDGSAWQPVSVPYPDGFNNVVLNDVVDIGPDNAWAVGTASHTASLGSDPLLMQWDGTAWTDVKAPSPPDSDGVEELHGVDAVAPDDVWVVGTYWPIPDDPYRLITRPVIKHWDGETWSLVPTPDLERAELRAVTAVSATNVWAVGVHDGQPLALHWDGETWNRVRLPTPAPERDTTRLYDIEVAPSGEIWASGRSSADFKGQGYLLHYQNGTWQEVRNSLTDARQSNITGVEITSAGDVWLAGYNRADSTHVGGDHFLRRTSDGWDTVIGADPDVYFGPARDAITLVDDHLWSVGFHRPTMDSNRMAYAELSPQL